MLQKFRLGFLSFFLLSLSLGLSSCSELEKTIRDARKKFDAVTILIDGPDAIGQDTCVEFRISTRNPDGDVGNVIADTLINLSSDGSVIFHSSGACDATVTSVTIRAGSSAARIYVKDSVLETVTITADDGSGALTAGTKTVTVSNGVTLASITIDPATVNYGAVAIGNKPTRPLILKNEGQSAANFLSGTVDTPFAFLGGIFPGTGGTCTTTLAVGESCSIVVEYTPSVPNMSDSKTLTIGFVSGTANTAGTATAQLLGLAQGAAASPAVLEISEAPTYDFGSVPVGDTHSKSFVLSNTGGTTATNIGEGSPTLSTPFSYRGSAGYPGTGGTCGTTLAAGQTCSFFVSFSPASAGNFSSTIRLDYSDGTNSQTVTRAVRGEGQVVVPPSPFMRVSSITYRRSGGFFGDRDLHVTIEVRDNNQNVVSGARVSVNVFRFGFFFGSGVADTGSNGRITFISNFAPFGCFDTDVTNVVKSGFIYDSSANAFDPGFCY